MKKLIIILAVLLLAPISLKAGEYQDEFTDFVVESDSIEGWKVWGNTEKGWCLELLASGFHIGGSRYWGNSIEDVFEKACDEWIEEDSIMMYALDTSTLWGRLSRLDEDTTRLPEPRPDLDSMIEDVLVWDDVLKYNKTMDIDKMWDLRFAPGVYYDCDTITVQELNIQQSLRNIIEVLKVLRK